jgi:hypothetical protein
MPRTLDWLITRTFKSLCTRIWHDRTNVGRELRFHGEAVSFELAHFTGLTFENLNATSGAARVAAAAVQDVDACVFDGEYEFLSVRWFSFDKTVRSLSLDFRHDMFTPD